MEPNIAPLAKRLAEENNVPWQHIAGTGANGRIVERDVLEYLSRVMAGEEMVDPTPEPLPEGMEAWPEEDVAAYYSQRAAQSAPVSPGSEAEDVMLELDHEDFGAEFDSDPVEMSSSVMPTSGEDVQDDIFIFDDEAGIDSDEDYGAEFAPIESPLDVAADVGAKTDSFIEPSGWDNLKADTGIEDLFASDSDDDLGFDDVDNIFVDDVDTLDEAAATGAEAQAIQEVVHSDFDSVDAESIDVDTDDLEAGLILDDTVEVAPSSIEDAPAMSYSEESYQPDPILDELIPTEPISAESEISDMDWEASEPDTASFDAIYDAAATTTEFDSDDSLEVEAFVHEYDASDDEAIYDADTSEASTPQPEPDLDDGYEDDSYEVVMSLDNSADEQESSSVIDIEAVDVELDDELVKVELADDHDLSAQFNAVQDSSVDDSTAEYDVAEAEVDAPLMMAAEALEELEEVAAEPVAVVGETELEVAEAFELSEVEVKMAEAVETVDLETVEIAEAAEVEILEAVATVEAVEEAEEVVEAVGAEPTEKEAETTLTASLDMQEVAESDEEPEARLSDPVDEVDDVAASDASVQEDVAMLAEADESVEVQDAVVDSVADALPQADTPAVVPVIPPTGTVGGRAASYGVVLRRHLDLTPLVQAQQSLSQELGQSKATVMQALLYNAAKKTHSTAPLNEEGRISLAIVQAEQIDMVVPGKAKTFAALVQAIDKAKPVDKSVALTVMDFSQSDIDEIELHMVVPVLTLGRVVYDEHEGSYRGTLTLAGDISIDAGSKFMAAVADLLNAPVRLVV